MSTDPIDLDDRRSLHRHKLRARSDHVIVTLPFTDGELAHILGRLEELLLTLDANDDDPTEDGSLSSPFAQRQASDAVGRLASYVAGVERGDPVQPVVPDGRYELVPLLFVSLGRRDLATIVAVADQLAAVRTRSCDPDLAMALGDYTRDSKDGEQLVSCSQRLAALLQLPWDDDVDLLHARLDRGAAVVVGERVVLSAPEHQAYERVTERILATWHGGDPLERYVYRGR